MQTIEEGLRIMNEQMAERDRERDNRRAAELIRNAEATLKFTIRDAVATTSTETGLRAGPAAEKLVDVIFTSITHPSTAWVFKELG